ncbi:hypothetical protein C8R45DRAFT_1038140 [Mycena sanguinolenta]|nr:hypothetical protein C8R45DRAFT_1038140 [Mycena sanguinolenta]
MNSAFIPQHPIYSTRSYLDSRGAFSTAIKYAGYINATGYSFFVYQYFSWICFDLTAGILALVLTAAVWEANCGLSGMV